MQLQLDDIDHARSESRSFAISKRKKDNKQKKKRKKRKRMRDSLISYYIGSAMWRLIDFVTRNKKIPYTTIVAKKREKKGEGENEISRTMYNYLSISRDNYSTCSNRLFIPGESRRSRERI